jgi:hypothetical protein
MTIILKILRFVMSGGDSGREMRIRIVGVIVMVVVISAILMLRTSDVPTYNPGDLLPTQAALIVRGRLPLRGEASDVLSEASERHAWQIEAEGGEYVNLRVRGELDSTLEIIPPGFDRSTAIDFSSGGGNQAFLCMQSLRRPGLYTVVVSSYLAPPNRAIGAYSLSVEPAFFEEARPLAAGETLTGRTDSCDGDFYTLTVSTGEMFEVTVMPEPGRDVFARLYRSRTAGELLGFSRSMTDAEGRSVDVMTFTATATGTLTLNVSAQVDFPPADYSITVRKLQP